MLPRCGPSISYSVQPGKADIDGLLDPGWGNIFNIINKIIMFPRSMPVIPVRKMQHLQVQVK